MKRHIYILGVPNFANYESSCALARFPTDGGTIDYVCIGEERLTRKKYMFDFPLHGIDYCLRHFGLDSLDEVDYIATDYARLPRWLNSGPGYRKGEHDYIKYKLKFPRERILVFDHHDAHAASCFYPSGFEDAGVLIVDGMGSALNTQSAYHIRNNQVVWRERGYDWGIGRLYSLVTAGVLPYGPERGYGKVMGLAPYGRSRSHARVLDFQPVDRGMRSDYSAFFTRYPISRFVQESVPRCEDRNRIMDPPFPQIAFEVQAECERQLVRMANYVHERTGTTRLCIAGGVALNGRANYCILKRTPIQDIWVQPACSDTGIPFGLTLWAWFQHLNHDGRYPRVRVEMHSASCGTSYAREDVLRVLRQYGVQSRPTTPAELAKLVANGKILAIFEGRSEFGPRALGNRSIVADPRDPSMKDKLNSSVKFRESYRPYAPAVMRDHLSEYFDLECDSPFMLIVADVRPDAAARIPAVTHIDGTARVQTLTPEHSPFFYDLVRCFHDETGVPVLLNTSFNINREPIVETPRDALICAFGTAIDFLYIEGLLVDCQEPRRPQLTQALIREREHLIATRAADVRRRYVDGYDRLEMDVFSREENVIADWHRNYSAKYVIEQCIGRWRTEEARVLLVGTPRHAECLFTYLADFAAVNWVGFVDWGGPGERSEFSPPIPCVRLSDVDWEGVDEVLVCSHEYQRDIVAELEARSGRPRRVTVAYDDSADSLIYTLPGSWPHPPLTPRGAGLVLSAQRQRTASNIDFDYEPTHISIADRYAVGIVFHDVQPKSPDARVPVGGSVTPEALEAQITALARTYQFATCAALLEPASGLSESAILIHFDDGLKSVIEHAFPILRRHSVPFTVFVCSRPLVERRILDAHRNQLLMTTLGPARRRAALDDELAAHTNIVREATEYAGDYPFYRYDVAEVRRLKMDLNYLLPYEIVNPAMDRIFEQTFGRDFEQQLLDEWYLSWDDLKRLIDGGAEIGVHTHNHVVLPRFDLKHQTAAIELCRDALAPLTGTARMAVSYPFGFLNDTTRRSMKTLQMLAGFTVGRKLITPQDIQERWALPRFDVQDCFDRASNAIKPDVFMHLSTGD